MYKKIVVCFLTALLVTGCGSSEAYSESPTGTTASAAEVIDVEEYYSENSKILASYSVSDSDSVQTEAEALADMDNRGFADYIVTYDYSADGEYLDEEGEASYSETDVSHPTYETYYVTSSDDVWEIISINGSVIANPLSYNSGSSRDVTLVVSESETITGYDSGENKFYETIPKESALAVYVVNTVNADTLDTLTSDILAAY